MPKEKSRSMQGLFRNTLMFPAQVVKGPYIKKITTWVALCPARLAKGSKSISLAYWTASSMCRTGSDQREKDRNRHCMTCLPHWGPPCNSFQRAVLTVGCDGDVALSSAGGGEANWSLQLLLSSKTRGIVPMCDAGTHLVSATDRSQEAGP